MNLSKRVGIFVLLVGLATASGAFAQSGRANKIVELLDSGKPVFGIFSGPKTPAGAVAQSGSRADFIFYSMETGPFDVPGMQVYMQFLFERKALASSTTNELPVITRIPPIRDGRVEAQDRTKRVLDAGAYGVVFPHVDSAGDAVHASQSMRLRPKGSRPDDTGVAARYWGVEPDDYMNRADLWPLNPEGELVNVILIEDQAGIANAREIVSAEGVTVAIPGPGDLNRAYEGDRAAVERAIQTTLAACKEFDVVCGITAGPDDIEKRLDEGFRFFIVTSPEAIDVGRRVSGR